MDKLLLVDARNALYRAIYAVNSDRRPGSKYHYFIALIRQISSWIVEHSATSVHIFWDAPRSEVWRRDVFPGYKDRDGKSNRVDISKELKDTTYIAQEMFKHMNVRQYNKKRMEADDLIYAMATVAHPKPMVIVTTDSDMIQIPFYFDSCEVYHPKKKEIVSTPKVNPVFQKALVGDDSDNIGGYDGIGPVKSEKMLLEEGSLEKYLKKSGKKKFLRNLLLIDLASNPKLLANKLYIQRKMVSPINFDGSKLKQLSQSLKVHGFLSEYGDFASHFVDLK